MKRTVLHTFLTIIIIAFSTILANAQTSAIAQAPWEKNPWTAKELIEPSALAAMLAKGSHPLIYNIGVVDNISEANHIGGVKEAENLEKFKEAISGLPKDTFFVFYCGCCPFAKCPNIRPAYNLVKEMGFQHARLLDLPTNLKTDWVDKGYPLEGEKK